MATNASRLSSVETIIDAIEAALADEFMTEYQIEGRRYSRPNLVAELERMHKLRDFLQRKVARGSSSPVRVAKLGRARMTDR